MRILFMSLALAAVGLAGCATSENPEAEQRAKAWESVNLTTDVTEIGAKRLKLTSSTPFSSGGDELEKAALMRAAGEAKERGYPRFAIVYVDYREGGLSRMFGPDLGEASKRWIGSYEDLLQARDRADLDGSLAGPFGFKRMEAVVMMLSEGDEQGRKAFLTDEVLNALTQDRIVRYNIKPSRHLKMPEMPSLPSFRRDK